MSFQEQKDKLRGLLRGGGLKEKKVQQAVGFAVFAVFIASSILINSNVHAIFQGVGQYGYYGGTYGYNTTTTSSDYAPAAPTSVSCTTADPNGSVCSWTAPTATEAGSSITSGGGGISFYYVNYGTSSLSSCTTGSPVTSTTTSKTIESLAASTTYYVAVCAVDTNGNPGLVATASFATSASASSSSGGGGGGGTVSSPSITPAPTVAAPSTSPSTAPTVADISQLLSEAQILANVEGLLRSIGVTSRNSASEKSYEARIKTVLGRVDDAATLQMLINFVTYGTSTTQILGAGERLGVLNSYRSAYGRIPSTEAQWLDIIKIANGRWPSETSPKAEARAKVSFKTIYKHEANMNDAHENAGVTVIAYGLRPANRNLNSEKAAIKNFRGIFGRAPSLATDWDMVRAIAYSGAKR